MPLAVALIFLVVGSLIFHFLSPWTFTPIASNWGTIDGTVDITLVVTGIVFVAVNIFMAYAVIKLLPRGRAEKRLMNLSSEAPAEVVVEHVDDMEDEDGDSLGQRVIRVLGKLSGSKGSVEGEVYADARRRRSGR